MLSRRLKGRWHCLLKQNEAGIERINSVVATCCVLHNMCEIFNEEFDSDLLTESEATPSSSQGETNNTNNNASSSENIGKALVLYCQQTDVQ